MLAKKRKIRKSDVCPIKKKVKTLEDEKNSNDKSNGTQEKSKTSKSISCMDDIRIFLNTAITDTNAASDYLKSGGKFKELFEILESLEVKNLHDIADVFHCIHYLFIDCANKLTKYSETIAKCCKKLLSSYKNIIQKLFKSGSNRFIVIALKLLKSIIFSDPANSARDVFFVLDLCLTNEIHLHKFRDNIDESDTVRSAFIDFSLACLVDTDVLVTRLWLSRNELVYTLVVNLAFDKYENVMLVMKSLDKYVLKRSDLQKNFIRTAFTTDVLKCLMNLYEWTGVSNKLYSLEHEKDIMEVTQDILFTLFTVKKYGIASNAILQSRVNAKQKHILLALKNSRMNEYQYRLTLKLFETSPDVLLAVMENYGSLLKSKNLEWDFVVKFLIEILTLHNPVNIVQHFVNSDAKYISNFIISATLPRTILEFMDERALLSPKNLNMIKDYLHLMATMLGLCQTYLTEVLKLNHLNQFDFKKIKFDALNRILAMFPKIDVIMKSLSKYIDTAKGKSYEAIEYAMDILLISINSFSSFIEASSFVMSYKTILQPIYEYKSKQNTFINAEFKAIKVVLALEPQSITLESELFEPILRSIANVFINGDKEKQIEANDLLLSIFSSTNLFEGNSNKANIWIQALLEIDKDLVPLIVDFLIGAFYKTKGNINAIRDKSHSLVNEAFVKFKNFDEILLEAAENESSVEETVETPTVDLLFIHVCSEELPEKFLCYLDYVALSYFLYFPHPEIIQNIYSKADSELNRYFKSWILEKQPKVLEFHNETIAKLASAIMNSEINLSSELKEYLNSGYKALQSIQIIVFHVVQLLKVDKFSEKQLKTCCFYFNEIIEILQKEYPAFVEDVLQYIFSDHHGLFQNFSIDDASKSNELLTNFLCEVGLKFKDVPQIGKYTKYYSNKLVNNIISTTSKPKDSLTKLLDIFQLTEQNYLDLLNHFAQLAHTSFISKTNDKTFCYELMCKGLITLAENGSNSIVNDAVLKISQFYINVNKENPNELNLDTFEQSFMDYLTAFPCQIDQIDDHFFATLFEVKRISKSTIKLATFILSRTDKFNGVYIDLLKTNISKKELIYPLTNVAFQKQLLNDKQLLSLLYNEFKAGINKTIDKPQKASVIYKENVFCGQKLIELCMPKNECIDFARKKIKVEIVEMYQLKLVNEILTKAFTLSSSDEGIYKNVITTLLQFFNILLKSEDIYSVVDKLNELILITYDWLKIGKTDENLKEVNFTEITQSAVWSQFAKGCLKHGISKRKSENKARFEDKHEVVLKLLSVIGDMVYSDDGNLEEISTYFNLIITHSEFLDVFLSQFNYSVKTSLAYLIFILLKKNKTIMNKKHVPIYLGAYGATLSDGNRIILAILQMYEQNKIQLHEFRPFLWGEAAIKHYSLGTETAANHLFNVDNIQIFDIISKEMMENTMRNFPVWRKLNSATQMPNVYSFDALKLDFDQQWHQSLSQIEVIVEYNETPGEHTMETCSVKSTKNNLIYDPAFFVSIMGMLFAPGAHDLSMNAAQTGCFSLLFTCLSSYDPEMRAASGFAILSSKSHLESGKKLMDAKLWLRLYNAVQSGLSTLSNNSQPAKKPSKDKEVILDVVKTTPQPAFISSLFIGESLNVLPDALNDLYSVTANYILITNTLNFQSVPNVMTLFHSADVKANEQKTFIMQIISNGIKTHSDFLVIYTTNILKALLAFYNSPMSNRNLNILIINMLNSIAKIPKSCEVMINKLGFLSWLNFNINEIESFHFDTIEAFMRIINNMWYSIKLMESEYDMNDVNRQILLLALKFQPLLSTRSSIVTLTKFLNILRKTINDNSLLINPGIMDNILEYFKQLFPDNFQCVDYIKKFGLLNCEPSKILKAKLIEQNVEKNTIHLLVDLREILIEWQKVHM